MTDDIELRSPPFDPSPAVQADWLAQAAALAQRRLAACAQGGTRPGAERLAARPSVAEAPLDGGLAAALDHLEKAADAGLSTTSPGYMAYIPGGGLLATALGDFVADILNPYTGLPEAAPAVAALEQDVLDWLAREVGYGAGAAGVPTSGGSTATLLAVIRARDAARARGASLERLTAYASEEAHGSLAGALHIAGLRPDALRRLPVDRALRLRPDALAEALATDRAAGLEPFLVMGTAGSTNTGAIDALDTLADLCGGDALWLHVDAAYGGAFLLCPEGRARLRGLARANSITLDPHKGFFLPYGTGCALFRDGVAKAADATYLRDLADGASPLRSPAAFGLELTRPFRGVRLWLPLMLHGAAAFRAALSEKLELAASLQTGLQGLAERGAIEVGPPPQLTVCTFRAVRQSGDSLGGWNDRTAALLDEIHARRRVFCSTTLLRHPLGEALTIRACILAHRTTAAEVNALLEDIAAAAGSSGGKASTIAGPDRATP